MSSQISSPRLSRALYRYLLRSCQYGKHPEIFGKYGSSAALSFASYKATNNEQKCTFPSSPSEVKNIFDHVFSVKNDDFSNIDPFAVLRYANETAGILYPPILPSRLPIFDYNASSALPGETVGFNFFEPRYLKLVEMAMSTCDEEKGGGYFLLRAGKAPRGGASLLKILNYKSYKDVIGVHCMAGPRIIIKMKENIPIHINNNEVPSLAVATDFDIWSEENNPLEKYTEKRNHILDSLSKVSDLTTAVHRVGLPPINITEFSFWALRFILSENDVASRQRWLFRCNDAEERMQYVQDYLETILDRKNASK